ncbi:MAG TPA: hypothetical protein VFT64_09070 [Rickettsiales bacterium]|nr:hypothetical protein [Rickettsiales bacterium]
MYFEGYGWGYKKDTLKSSATGETGTLYDPGKNTNFITPPRFYMKDPVPAPGQKFSTVLAWEITRALIEIAGGEVQASAANSVKDKDIGTIYTQDPFFVIPQLQVAVGRTLSSDSAQDKSAELDPEEQEKDKYIEPGKTQKAIQKAYGHAQQEHARILKSEGYMILTVLGNDIQGGNLLYHAGSNTIFQGYYPDRPNGKGTEADCKELEHVLRKMVDPSISVIQVPVIQDKSRTNYRYVFHIDEYMNVLPKGEILLDSNLLSAETIEKIKQIVGEENVIANDNLKKNHNFITVGDTIITDGMPVDLQRDLVGRGYNIMTRLDIVDNPILFNQVFEKLKEYDVRSRPAAKELEWGRSQFDKTFSALASGKGLDTMESGPVTDDEFKRRLRNSLASGETNLTIRDGGIHCLALQTSLGERDMERPTQAMATTKLPDLINQAMISTLLEYALAQTSSLLAAQNSAQPQAHESKPSTPTATHGSSESSTENRAALRENDVVPPVPAMSFSGLSSLTSTALFSSLKDSLTKMKSVTAAQAHVEDTVSTPAATPTHESSGSPIANSPSRRR